MWRYKSLLGNEGSDQSISDEEEEQDVASPENFVSLAGTLDRKKEVLGVASQLELLKGGDQKNVGFSSEDEVEIPDFQEKSDIEWTHNSGGKSISLKRDGSTCKVDERISVYEGSKMLFNSVIAGATVSETLDLYTRGKGKQGEPSTGYTVDKDARRLVQLGEKASCSGRPPSYTKDGYPAIGDRQTVKTRLASHLQPPKKGALIVEDPDSTTDDELLDEPEALDYQLMDKPTSELVGASDGEKMLQSSHALPVEAVIQHDYFRNSMVELLDELRGKSRNHHLKSKTGGRRKGRTGQHAIIKSVSSLQRAVPSDEDPCEIMNSGSSTDKEEEAQNLKVAVVESRRITMADKFQEAFDSAAVDNGRPPFTVRKQSSIGLFGRLQQVMQWQKEQDTEFSKMLQAEVWPKDEARCIDVKILSRSFDAKLTVCHCSLLINEESSLENPQQENFGKLWNIIFNSRVCGDVDLEVANLVRVHPPWKEVQVPKCGEIIILATYFSQIYT